MEWLPLLECDNGEIQALRKDRPRRQGEGVPLFMTEQLESMELCLGIDEESTKSL